LEKPIEIEDSETEETKDCMINCEVKIDDQEYLHAGTVLHYPGHFWSLVRYHNRIWVHGDWKTGDVRVEKDVKYHQPYITKGNQRGSPVVDVYAKKDVVTSGKTNISEKINAEMEMEKFQG